MISIPYTFVEEDNKGIYYYSDTDFEYSVKTGDKCAVTVDEECIEWIAGVVCAINDDSFELDTMNGKKISIQCEDICDMHGEEELKKEQNLDYFKERNYHDNLQRYKWEQVYCRKNNCR